MACSRKVMGNTTFSNEQLQEEECRVNTFGENSNIPNKEELAKSGFYFTQIDQKIKCIGCGLEVDTSIVPSQDVPSQHREKYSTCAYASSQLLLQKPIKKFISYDSLRFEKERLETFIDWPIQWLNPSDLARDGFYYLRTADHCACVFCRGIVGAWEKGDIPRVEHQRHFPQCPFIKGEPVGNVPIAPSSIISRTVLRPDLSPSLPSMELGRMEGSRLGTLIECDLSREAAYSEVDFWKYFGSKRKEFILQEDRERSFANWPQMVKQRPKELAEAGFFYCGLNDLVQCFHCGNCLHSWKKDGRPWEEHARWYPECNFVQIKKGQEFIDKVRREKLPYLRSQTTSKSTFSFETYNITEGEMNHFMEQDVIKTTLGMGFSADKVRGALRRNLQRTRQPFFTVEICVEAVLQYMEEEMRFALNLNSNVEREAAEQGARMEALQASERQVQDPTNETTPTPSSYSSSTLFSPASPSTHPEPMEIEYPDFTSDEVLSETDNFIGLAESVLYAEPTPSSSPTPNQSSTTSTPTTPPTTAASTATATAPTAAPSSQPQDKMVKEDKKEYPPMVKELTEELEKIKNSRMCKICMDAEIEMVFLPCAHMVSCSSCSPALTQCPICRNEIWYPVKTILS